MLKLYQTSNKGMTVDQRKSYQHQHTPYKWYVGKQEILQNETWTLIILKDQIKP